MTGTAINKKILSASAQFRRISPFLRVVALTTFVYTEFVILMMIFPHIDSGLIAAIYQVYTLIYLLIIPGILIFGLLDLSVDRTLLYLSLSVGMSVAVAFVLGFAGNLLLQFLGIDLPLLSNNLRLLSAGVYLVMCGGIIRGNNTYSPISNSHIPKRVVLLMISVVLLVTLGGIFVYRYNSSLVLGLILGSIIAVPLLGASEVEAEYTYPVAILTTSVVLVAQRVMSSPYLQAADIHFEYSYASRISREASWAAADNLLLSTLSSVVFHKVTAIDLVYIMKYISPVVGILLPVVLYYVYNKQTYPSNAFFAAVLFISVPRFFNIAPTNLKQTFAKFYISFLLYVLITDISEYKRKLLILFSLIFIAVSHYGTAYILLLLILPALVTLFILKKYNLYRESVRGVLTPTHYAFFITITISWYLYTNSGEKAIFIYTVPRSALSNLGFGGGGSKGALHYATVEVPPSLRLYRALLIISVLIMGFGFLYMSLRTLLCIVKDQDSTPEVFTVEYLLISAFSFGLVIASFVLPSIVGTGTVGFARVFHIMLIWISIYFLYGLISVNEAGNYIGLPRLSEKKMRSLVRIGAAVLLISSLAISTGLAPEVIQRTTGGDYTPGSAIGHPRIETDGTVREKIVYYGQNYPEADIMAARWLGEHQEKGGISVDNANALHPLISYGGLSADTQARYLSPNTEFDRAGCSYIYLRTLNIEHNIMQTQAGIDLDQRSWTAAPLVHQAKIKCHKLHTTGSTTIYS